MNELKELRTMKLFKEIIDTHTVTKENRTYFKHNGVIDLIADLITYERMKEEKYEPEQ